MYIITRMIRGAFLHMNARTTLLKVHVGAYHCIKTGTTALHDHADMASTIQDENIYQLSSM